MKMNIKKYYIYCFLENLYPIYPLENEGRSTVHSIISLSQSLYAIVCFGIFGLVASAADLLQLLLLCGIYICICIAVTGAIYFLLKGRAAKG